MAIPAKTQPELSTRSPHLIHKNPHERAVVHTCPPEPLFRCESCGQPITHSSDVIIEDEYGYEGEAWGSACRQQPLEVAITTCCRASIIDKAGEPLSAYEIRDCL